MVTNLSARVIVLAGGGVAHTSGGVGTLMSYLMQIWATQSEAPAVTVIDTRGQAGMVSAAWYFARVALMLLWLRALGRVDLVHAHMTTRGSAVRKTCLCSLATTLRIPVVLHMHGADFMPFYRSLRPIFRAPLRAVLQHSRCIIVVGQAWRDFLMQDMGVEPARIEIVLNGVPAQESFSHEADACGRVRLLFLGRIGARKGVPELIEALARPVMRHRQWSATIAGDGDNEHFHTLLERYGLADRVAMPGWVDQGAKHALLAQADILVLPSHHEAMPIAVLEALSFGIPVITTPVGAIPEFLENNVTALLVPPGDIDALAAAMVRLIDDPHTRARLGQAGQQVFLARLDIRIVSKRILRIYDAAMQDGSKKLHTVSAP